LIVAVAVNDCVYDNVTTKSGVAWLEHVMSLVLS
jgi:hypothetical protein